MLIVPMDWSWQIFSLNFRPWRLFLICVSLINLWNGLVFSVLPESPKFLLAINEKEKALQVLRRVYAFNTRQPEQVKTNCIFTLELWSVILAQFIVFFAFKQNYPIKNIKSESNGNRLTSSKGFCNIVQLLWSQTKPIFIAPLLSHTWKLCYLIFAIFLIGHGNFLLI